MTDLRRRLSDWSHAPKTRQGYEFGDITASVVRRVLPRHEPAAGGCSASSSSAVAQASAAAGRHPEAVRRVLQERRMAVEMLEEHLAIIEARQQELEQKKEEGVMTEVERVTLFRIYGIHMDPSAMASGSRHRVSAGCPLTEPQRVTERFRRALEEGKADMAQTPTLDEDTNVNSDEFVNYQAKVAKLLRVAKHSRRMARSISGDSPMEGASFDDDDDDDADESPSASDEAGAADKAADEACKSFAEAVDPGLRCLVCLARKKCMFSKSCGHIAACEECFGELTICPVCRAELSGGQKAYF